MRAVLLVCVACLILGMCAQTSRSEEPRSWILIVCGPKGQFCIPYTSDMVYYRYQTKTACDVDSMFLPIPTGYNIKCGKENTKSQISR